jgi:hypothetical protein
MEGCRQEEVEEKLLTYFAPVKICRHSSFVRLLFENQALSGAIDPDREEDRKFLEYLFDLDFQQVCEGRLKPVELFAVLKKKPRAQIARTLFSHLGSALKPTGKRARIPVICKEIATLAALPSAPK